MELFLQNVRTYNKTSFIYTELSKANELWKYLNIEIPKSCKKALEIIIITNYDLGNNLYEFPVNVFR